MLFDVARARRPVVDIQAEPSDCGYLCLSALITTFGKRATLDRIKELSGRTSRGLNIKQLRDASRSCGFEAEAIYFDKASVQAFPEFGIVLLAEGHFVAIAGRNGSTFELYDPRIGWIKTSHRRLARACTGLAIQIERKEPTADGLFQTERPKSDAFDLARIVRDPSTRRALVLLVIAQAVVLGLPLLSMWSVDESLEGFSFGLAGVIVVGFAALTITSAVISILGEVAFVRVKRFATVAMSKRIFAALGTRPASWFETNRASTLHHRISSAFVYLDFRINLARAAITIVLTLVVGLGFIFLVSPWLAIPGLVTVTLNTVLHAAFHQSERSAVSAQLDTTQRRQSFVFDVLSQLPLLSRHGALASARTRYVANSRAVALANARVQKIRTWRDSIASLARSAETLLFVLLAAIFMGMGEFTIGGFVALGAYKDLLAQSLGSLFQLFLQSRTFEVHRMQADAVLQEVPGEIQAFHEVQSGRITACNLSFSYSSFEKPVFSGVAFELLPGQSVAIKGESGCGKSTLLKIMAGQLQPLTGQIRVDEYLVHGALGGVASVLQTDRVIGGTIRDNLTLFRKNVDEDRIKEALKLAQIYDFVMDLPMRLETSINEGLVGLSGGQRQRILLARAFVTRPRVLILDEAMSSLAVEMERDIICNLRRLQCTLILVTHRPEVWRMVDRLFSFEEGQLRETSLDESVETRLRG